mmetsp:Transcript_13920/g.15375  ORF Transcript_13920/g.15375 Transcript_13920/m.15375 type:complete len:728 (-) Transcript_13920:42-2225(-)
MQSGNPQWNQAPPADVHRHVGAHGGFHSYSREETRSFADYINYMLKDDPDLTSAGDIPIDPATDALFRVCAKGLLLPKLINAVKAHTVLEKSICKKPNANTWETNTNHTLAIEGAKQIGCNVINIGASDLTAGTPHLILGLVWQVVKIGLLSQVNLDEHPELVAMLDPSEDLNTFINVAPEINLLRWFNYQLKRKGHSRRVKNFSNDIKDGENYLVLLNAIAPNVVPEGAHREPDPRKRAEMVCKYAKDLDCGKFVTPEDILAGNDKLNLAFTAYLFNKHPGLEVEDDDARQKKILEEAERLMQEKWAREEAERKARWDKEQEEKHKQWEQQEAERRRQWELQEAANREKMANEKARVMGELSEAEKKWREQMEREEAERRRRNHEEEEARRRKQEELRQLEAKREQLRLEEEERRRQWEADMKRRERLLKDKEDEAKLQAEAKALEEENRRRAWEEEQMRKEEEERRRWEEEMRRREEEERRQRELEAQQQRAWEAQMSHMAAQERQRLEAERQRRLIDEQQRAQEEAKRQAAWKQYYEEQEAAKRRAAQQEAAQRAAQEEAARLQAWQSYYRQQSVMVQQYPPQQTNTVVRTVTTEVKSKFPIQRLVVTVMEGRRLAKKDTFGSADPYCVLVHNGIKRKTSYVKNTREPHWHQDFEFLNVREHDHIVLKVFDKDTFGKDDFMGEIDLSKGDFNGNSERWFPLKARSYKYDRVHGEIKLRFKIMSY